MCALQLNNLSSLVQSVTADNLPISSKESLVIHDTKTKKSRRKESNINKQKVNERERERKELLSNLITKLQDILPCDKKLLKKKKNVIEESIKYINELKDKNEDLLKKNSSENMVEELDNLRKQVKDLVKERTLYRAILQSHGIPVTLSSNVVPWKTKVGLSKNKANVPANQPQPTVLQLKNIVDQSVKHLVVPQVLNNPVLNFITVPAVTNIQTSICKSSSSIETSKETSVAITPSKTTCASALLQPSLSDDDVFVHDNSVLLKTKKVIDKVRSSIGSVLDSQSKKTASEVVIFSKKSNDLKSVSSNLAMITLHSNEVNNVALADCSTVWSQARIKTNDISEIPNLPIVAIEKECQTIENSNMAEENNLNFQQFNFPTLAPSKPNMPNSIINASITSVSNSSDIISVLGSTSKPIPLIVVNSQPSLITNSSMAPTVMDVELQVGNQTSLLPQIQTACEIIEPTVSSEQPLVFWLRSSDQNNQDTSETSTQTYNVDINDTPTKLNANQLFPSPSNPNKRPVHGSFNIADLIKPKDISTPLFTDANNNNLSKIIPVSNQDNADVNDFNIGTPRDLLYQTFDNDFLECLQNLNSFATPEPPCRHPSGSNKTDKRKNNLISIELPDLFRPITDANTIQQIDNDKSQTNDSSFSLNNFNMVSLSGNNMINHTTSLWQPAITNQPSHSKMMSNYIPNHHPPADCDPVPYYLNLNQSNIPRFGPSAPIQPITHYSSVDATQMWIPSANQDNNQILTQQSTIASLPVPKQCGNKQKKLDPAKKRKLTRTCSGSKRKKLSTKIQQKGITSQPSGQYIPICNQSPRNQSKQRAKSSHSLHTIFSPHTKNNNIGFSHEYNNQSNYYLAANNQQQTSYTPSPYIYQYKSSNQNTVFVPNPSNLNNSNNGTKSNKSSLHHISQILS